MTALLWFVRHLKRKTEILHANIAISSEFLVQTFKAGGYSYFHLFFRVIRYVIMEIGVQIL